MIVEILFQKKNHVAKLVSIKLGITGLHDICLRRITIIQNGLGLSAVFFVADYLRILGRKSISSRA